MFHLLLILTPLALLTGFVALVQYETRTGVRFFAPRRDALDTAVERIQFIVEHVDLAAFAAEEIRHVGTVISHALVTVSLRAVRSVERLLTRLVRYLRAKSESTEPPHETAREFVRTLSDFKDTLKTSYPGVPEIK